MARSGYRLSLNSTFCVFVMVFLLNFSSQAGSLEFNLKSLSFVGKPGEQVIQELVVFPTTGRKEEIRIYAEILNSVNQPQRSIEGSAFSEYSSQLIFQYPKKFKVKLNIPNHASGDYNGNIIVNAKPENLPVAQKFKIPFNISVIEAERFAKIELQDLKLEPTTIHGRVTDYRLKYALVNSGNIVAALKYDVFGSQIKNLNMTNKVKIFSDSITLAPGEFHEVSVQLAGVPLGEKLYVEFQKEVNEQRATFDSRTVGFNLNSEFSENLDHGLQIDPNEMFVKLRPGEGRLSKFELSNSGMGSITVEFRNVESLDVNGKKVRNVQVKPRRVKLNPGAKKTILLSAFLDQNQSLPATGIQRLGVNYVITTDEAENVRPQHKIYKMSVIDESFEFDRKLLISDLKVVNLNGQVQVSLLLSNEGNSIETPDFILKLQDENLKSIQVQRIKTEEPIKPGGTLKLSFKMREGVSARLLKFQARSNRNDLQIGFTNFSAKVPQ